MNATMYHAVAVVSCGAPRWTLAVVLAACAAAAPATVQCGEAGDPVRKTARLEWIRVSDDGSHFVTAASGRRFIAWGVNYDRDEQGRLIEDYWEKEWDAVVRDLEAIRALNANAVRIHLQFGRFMKSADVPHPAALRRLARLVETAEELGLYLNLTGLGCYHKQDTPEWYDALSESDRWDAQAAFWRAVAGVCKQSPAVFCYDLMNEPIIGGDPEKPGWVTGQLGGKHFVQRITLDPAGRAREEIAAAWTRRLAAAIREVDDRRLLTVGVIPWAHVFPGAKPLFYSPQAGEPLDFVSVHFYPRRGEVDRAITALKVYDVGKPLVVEEIFPLHCSIDEAVEFIEQSREIADGWFSFYWGTTIEEYREQGDLRGAIIARWLETFRELGPRMTGDARGGAPRDPAAGP